MKERLLDMFRMDLRLLGIFRILLGILIIIDIINRSFDLSVFYTDEGVFPRKILLENEWNSWNYCLNLFSGSTAGQAIYFFFTAFCALMVAIGFRTKLFLFLTYILVVSIQIRNAQITNGGDIIIKMMLFYSLFLPLNARYAVDKFKKSSLSINGKVLSIATIAFIVQVISVYVFASIQKSGFAWQDGSAVYYAMNLEMFSTPLSSILRQFPDLMSFLTYSTHFFERYGFILLFIPVFWKYFRVGGVLAFMLLHLGFALFLQLGTFPYASWVMWIPLFPSSVADALERFIKKITLYEKLYTARNKLRNYIKTKFFFSFQNRIYRPLNIPLSAFVLLAMVSIFYWNLSTINLKNFKHPELFKSVARVTAMWQSWNMFAPIPMRVDGWFVIDGQLKNGQHVDVLTGRSPVSFDRPEKLSSRFKNERWQKWLVNMWVNQKPTYLASWGGYYCNCWNKEHKNSQKELETFTIYFMKEMIPPPGQVRKEAQKVSIWSHWCDEKFKDRFK